MDSLFPNTTTTTTTTLDEDGMEVSYEGDMEVSVIVPRRLEGSTVSASKAGTSHGYLSYTVSSALKMSPKKNTKVGTKRLRSSPNKVGGTNMASEGLPGTFFKKIAPFCERVIGAIKRLGTKVVSEVLIIHIGHARIQHLLQESESVGLILKSQYAIQRLSCSYLKCVNGTEAAEDVVQQVYDLIFGVNGTGVMMFVLMTNVCGGLQGMHFLGSSHEDVLITAIRSSSMKSKFWNVEMVKSKPVCLYYENDFKILSFWKGQEFNADIMRLTRNAHNTARSRDPSCYQSCQYVLRQLEMGLKGYDLLKFLSNCRSNKEEVVEIVVLENNSNGNEMTNINNIVGEGSSARNTVRGYEEGLGNNKCFFSVLLDTLSISDEPFYTDMDELFGPLGSENEILRKLFTIDHTRRSLDDLLASIRSTGSNSREIVIASHCWKFITLWSLRAELIDQSRINMNSASNGEVSEKVEKVYLAALVNFVVWMQNRKSNPVVLLLGIDNVDKNSKMVLLELMIVVLFGGGKGEDVKNLCCSWVLDHDEGLGLYVCRSSSILRTEFSGLAFVVRRSWLATLAIALNDKDLFDKMISNANLRDKQLLSVLLNCDLGASAFSSVLKLISIIDNQVKDNSFNSTCSVDEVEYRISGKVNLHVSASKAHPKYIYGDIYAGVVLGVVHSIYDAFFDLIGTTNVGLCDLFGGRSKIRVYYLEGASVPSYSSQTVEGCLLNDCIVGALLKEIWKETEDDVNGFLDKVFRLNKLLSALFNHTKTNRADESVRVKITNSIGSRNTDIEFLPHMHYEGNENGICKAQVHAIDMKVRGPDDALKDRKRFILKPLTATESRFTVLIMSMRKYVLEHAVGIGYIQKPNHKWDELYMMCLGDVIERHSTNLNKVIAKILVGVDKKGMMKQSYTTSEVRLINTTLSYQCEELLKRSNDVDVERKREDHAMYSEGHTSTTIETNYNNSNHYGFTFSNTAAQNVWDIEEKKMKLLGIPFSDVIESGLGISTSVSTLMTSNFQLSICDELSLRNFLTTEKGGESLVTAILGKPGSFRNHVLEVLEYTVIEKNRKKDVMYIVPCSGGKSMSYCTNGLLNQQFCMRGIIIVVTPYRLDKFGKYEMSLRAGVDVRLLTSDSYKGIVQNVSTFDSDSASSIIIASVNSIVSTAILQNGKFMERVTTIYLDEVHALAMEEEFRFEMSTMKKQLKEAREKDASFQIVAMTGTASKAMRTKLELELSLRNVVYVFSNDMSCYFNYAMWVANYQLNLPSQVEAAKEYINIMVLHSPKSKVLILVHRVTETDEVSQALNSSGISAMSTFSSKRHATGKNGNTTKEVKIHNDELDRFFGFPFLGKLNDKRVLVSTKGLDGKNSKYLDLVIIIGADNLYTLAQTNFRCGREGPGYCVSIPLNPSMVSPIMKGSETVKGMDCTAYKHVAEYNSNATCLRVIIARLGQFAAMSTGLLTCSEINNVVAKKGAGVRVQLCGVCLGSPPFPFNARTDVAMSPSRRVSKNVMGNVVRVSGKEVIQRNLSNMCKAYQFPSACLICGSVSCSSGSQIGEHISNCENLKPIDIPLLKTKQVCHVCLGKHFAADCCFKKMLSVVGIFNIHNSCCLVGCNHSKVLNFDINLEWRLLKYEILTCGDEGVFIRDKVLQIILYFRRVKFFNDVLMLNYVDYGLSKPPLMTQLNNDWTQWLSERVDKKYMWFTQLQVLVEMWFMEVRKKGLLDQVFECVIDADTRCTKVVVIEKGIE